MVPRSSRAVPPRTALAAFRFLFHHASVPRNAKIRPGIPAPAVGAGTDSVVNMV
jgi:hypothetical protein